MNPADLCQAWRDLLKKEIPAQIFDLFKQEQQQLVSHLLSCINCSLRVRRIFPMDFLTNDEIKNMSAPNFEKLIRGVRKTYRTKWP